ncbi:hypothetical protein ACWEWL_32700 [Streptomyces rochei]
MVVIVLLLPVLLVLMLFGLDVLERSLFPDADPDQSRGSCVPTRGGESHWNTRGP